MFSDAAFCNLKEQDVIFCPLLKFWRECEFISLGRVLTNFCLSWKDRRFKLENSVEFCMMKHSPLELLVKFLVKLVLKYTEFSIPSS